MTKIYIEELQDQIEQLKIKNIDLNKDARFHEREAEMYREREEENEEEIEKLEMEIDQLERKQMQDELEADNYNKEKTNE